MIDISPLVKYGLLIVAFLAVCAGLIAYGAHLKQTEWDASVAQQQMATGENIVKNAQNTARIESEFQRKIEAQAARVRVVNKEVKVYVEGPSKQCILSPEFVSTFDGISRLYDTTPDGLPASPDTSGAAVVKPEAQLTDAEALSAYEHAVTQLFANYERSAALVEWVRSSHAIAAVGAGRE